MFFHSIWMCANFFSTTNTFCLFFIYHSLNPIFICHVGLPIICSLRFNIYTFFYILYVFLLILLLFWLFFNFHIWWMVSKHWFVSKLSFLIWHWLFNLIKYINNFFRMTCKIFFWQICISMLRHFQHNEWIKLNIYYIFSLKDW